MQSLKMAVRSQHVEQSNSCATTLSILQRTEAQALIMPETALSNTKLCGVSSVVSKVLGSDPSGMQIEAAKRRDFDDTKGFESLSHIAKQPGFSKSWRGYYLAAGAAHALLTFMSDQLSTVALAGTTEIFLDKLDNHMYIDSAAIDALELVQPARRSSSVSRRHSSLFSWLNHTFTSCGGESPLHAHGCDLYSSKM